MGRRALFSLHVYFHSIRFVDVNCYELINERSLETTRVTRQELISFTVCSYYLLVFFCCAMVCDGPGLGHLEFILKLVGVGCEYEFLKMLPLSIADHLRIRISIKRRGVEMWNIGYGTKGRLGLVSSYLHICLYDVFVSLFF